MTNDIVIVGAGLSGLYLAYILEKAGIDYVLIEARERLGGRIKTVQYKEAGFDLGPTWFWPGQPLMENLIQNFNIPYFGQYSKGRLVFEDQNRRIQHDENFLSTQGYYRLDGGMGALINALEKEIPESRLQEGDAVIGLSKKEGILLASGKKIKSKTTILAIPPRLAAKLVYSPSLDTELIKTMHHIPTWMGGQAKFLAIYKNSFWKEAGLSGRAISHYGPLVEIHDASNYSGSVPALFGFVGIPPQNRKDQEDTLKQQALLQFARLFGEEALKPEKVYLEDWAFQENTSTPQDQTMPGFHPRYGRIKELENIWDGQVQLCNGEVAPDFGGYMEGALSASKTMAEKIKKEHEEI